MDGLNPRTKWIEALFDVSQPYPYILILSLILFALGYRWTAALAFVVAMALVGLLNLA